MKKKLLFVFLFCEIVILTHAQQDLRLHYSQPAAKWTDALPLGNGRLGAMVYGGVTEDHLQINEETFWNGGPREYARNGASNSLQQIRSLLSEGKQAQADELAEKNFMGLRSDEETYPQKKQAWIEKVRSLQIPATAGSDWKTMQVPTSNGWETSGLEAVDGAVVFTTGFDLPEAWQGKDLVLYLGRIRDQDFTYINGKLTGTTDGNTISRKYKVDKSVLQKGRNTISVQILNFNDKGGFVTPRPNEKTMLLGLADDSTVTPLKLSNSWQYKVQDDTPPATPKYQADYQPFVDLWIRSIVPRGSEYYTRELNLNTATAKTIITVNDIDYVREYFISAPANALAVRISASKPGLINLAASLSTFHVNARKAKHDANTISLIFDAKAGVLHGASFLRAENKSGKLLVSADSIIVQNADEVVFYLTGSTSFVNYHDVSANASALALKALSAIRPGSYPTIQSAHVKEYKALFDKFYISLGKGIGLQVPTDLKIKIAAGTFDPDLLAIYIQYSRYLLISSSRPGTQAANLQGIWNNLLTPPWGSKYTSNINLQMNYWGAELFNLSACASPLFDMIGELAEAGKKTAQANYAAPGWVLHHNTDLWRGTAPINAANHGIWQGGAGWLGKHLWEHYLFTGDKVFLQKRGYPAMKSAAMFYLSALYPDPHSEYLISSPSNSPENGGLVEGPTMDHQIIRELFRNCIEAANVLNIDKDFIQTLQLKIPKIAPNKIGKYGQLQEWIKDVDDTSNKHRHVSHLWGVYPGTDITWDKNPEMMKAARQSLVYRGDSGTGWSLAWKTNLWARFKDGNHALRMVKLLLSPAEGPNGSERGGVYKNMFDAHPPFQIDGNFGGAAGVAEMLVQSHAGYIDIFPALPVELFDGEIRGLCARGGFELDLSWSAGKLVKLTVLSKNGNDCRIVYAGKEWKSPTVTGKRYEFDVNLKLISR